MRVLINARRSGYSPDQIRHTMTVSQLVAYLGQFDEDAEVYLSHDNGYTYGGITESDFLDSSEEEE